MSMRIQGLILLARAYTGNLQTKLEHVRACGDVEAAIVGITERHVCSADPRARFACRLRQIKSPDRFAFRRCDLDATWCAAAGCIEVAFSIDAHAVGAVLHEQSSIRD